MLCTGANFADFFVWSSKQPCHQERISTIVCIRHEILQRSFSFFYGTIMPELFGKHYTNAAEKEQRKKKAFAIAKAEPTFRGTLLKKSTKARTHCNRISEIEVNSSSSSKSISRSKFQLYIEDYSRTTRQLQI